MEYVEDEDEEHMTSEQIRAECRMLAKEIGLQCWSTGVYTGNADPKLYARFRILDLEHNRRFRSGTL